MNEQTQSKATAAAAACKKIINETRINRAISAGCQLQILKDIKEKSNPYRIILTAAECIGRLSNSGDSFYNEVQAAMLTAFGADPAEVPTKGDGI